MSEETVTVQQQDAKDGANETGNENITERVTNSENENHT